MSGSAPTGSGVRPLRARAAALELATVCGLAALVLAGGANLVPSARATGSPPALQLTATPASGYAPLLVQFNLSYPGTIPPQVFWSFGDGAYLNGSGTTDLRPAHEYLVNGTFVARVTAAWASGDLNASLPVVVRSGVLTVALNVSPARGAAPLTVNFTATASGGSSTYVSYLWQFGDGDSGSGPAVRYTYTRVGTYLVNFSLEDASADRANATATIVVGPGPAGPSTPGIPSSSDPWPTAHASYLVAGALLAGGAATLIAVAVWRRRSAAEWRRNSDPPIPPELSLSGTEPAAPVGTIDAATESAAAARDRVEGKGAGGGSAEGSGPGRGVQVALRLVGRLSALERTDAQELRLAERTQAALAESLSVRQSAVSRALRRLVAGGLVEVRAEHVSEIGRRVRVYRLTDRGAKLGDGLDLPPAQEPVDPTDGP